MSGRRTIIVANREWKYRVGKSFCVAKATDTGEGKRIRLEELTGLSSRELERAQYKRYFHITPKDIAAWLATK